MRCLLGIVLAAVMASGCGGGGAELDAGDRDAQVDAGARDDASLDGGLDPDAGDERDAATIDGGQADAGPGDGGTLDAGPATARVIATSWRRSFQGASTLSGPWIDVQPDGTVVGAFDYGSESDPTVIGAGEPGEATLTGRFKNVVVWLDGDDGTLVRARQIAADVSATERASVVAQAGIAVTSTGQVLAGGQWHGSAVFHPGSALTTTMVAEKNLVGGTLHRAEDPYLTRFTPDGTPEWVTRGRTPGPLSDTWFNYAIGVAALPGGGAFHVGHYEYTGFVVGSGTSGAVTLSGTRQTYFARYDASGVPTWVARNTNATFWLGSDVSSDGSVTLVPLLSLTTTLLTGTAAATDMPAVVPPAGSPALRSYGVTRLDPTNAIAWWRRIVTPGFLSSFEVRDDASVIVTGTVNGTVELHDASGAVALSLTTLASSGWIASFAADGTPEWIVETGTGDAAAIADSPDGSAWIFGSIPPGATIDVGGAALELPAIATTIDDSITIALHVTRTGALDDAAVVGVDVPVRRAVRTPAGAIAITGLDYGSTSGVRIGDGAGALVELPACVDGMGQCAIYAQLVP